MKLNDALILANDLLAQHDLTEWNVAFDNAKRRLGQTKFSTRTISLSREITELNPVEQVKNTILHEIAHALVGPNNGHNQIWRQKALSIGCNGERTTNSLVRAPSSYSIKCLHCGASWNAYRKPNLFNVWHKQCGKVSINRLVLNG